LDALFRPRSRTTLDPAIKIDLEIGDRAVDLLAKGDRQGKSGLGLEAQRQAVDAYLNGGDWQLVEESVEVESGRSCERPKLEAALQLCRAHRAALGVANVLRLTRSVAFLSKLLAADVEIRFIDLPIIEGATGRFLLQQMASVAALEAGMIGERTRKALAAAKARGKKLGGFRGRAGTAEDAAKARKAHTAKALGHAESLAPIITRLDPDGSLSLRALAAKLTAEGLPTPAGAAVWTAVGVARVKAKLAA
jgi:DNA invertase Pin-like site-specific DNA recombinase